MKSLYFATHQLLPVNTGSRLRDYHLAHQLAEHSSLTFVEMRGAAEEHRAFKHDGAFANMFTLHKDRTNSPSNILRGLVGPTPMTVLNCWSRQSASALSNIVRSGDYDTVQIEGVHLVNYLPIIRQALRSPAIVADWHNIESELMWRYSEITRNQIKKLVAIRTAKLLASAEDRLLETCTTHTVPSERERRKLLARRPGANIKVIPNAIDTAHWSSQYAANARSGPTERTTILFVGSMDYHANIDAVLWFAKTAWPEIAKQHPHLQFTIVGRKPPEEIRSLVSDRISITGTVDDVRPFYESAAVAVVPIRSGGGTRLKILEAMAAGVPVVSTRLGAEGIDAEDDVHFLLADTASGIAAGVHRLISSADTRTRIVRAARAQVCALYDWTIVGKRLCEIHEQLAKSRDLNVLTKAS